MGDKNKLSRVRHIGIIIALVFLATIFISAIISSFTGGEKKDNVPRPNLDNFIIEELTEEQIIKISDFNNSLLSSWKSSGKSSGIRNIKYEKQDHDKTTFTAKKTVGIKTVSATLATDCKLYINIACEVSSGNAKIVILMDDTILECFNFGEKSSLEYDVNGKHEFYVKILCEDAEIEITVERRLANL